LGDLRNLRELIDQDDIARIHLAVLESAMNPRDDLYLDLVDAAVNAA
jgi:hypothetical protein